MIIPCPECKNQVSDQADSCPHCGLKISNPLQYDRPPSVQRTERKPLGRLFLIGAPILIVAVFVFFSVSKSHDDELAAKEQQIELIQSEARLENQRAAEEARLASIPELPVSISTRNSLLGSGIVAVFENNSSNEFAVIAEFTNPGINATKTVRIDLPAKSKIEVGHLEGWRFQSGDTIKLINEHYKELFSVVP